MKRLILEFISRFILKNRRLPGSYCLTATLMFLPDVVYAQYVPIELAAAAFSPLLVILLAIIYGLLMSSWRVAGRHVGLVVLWVVLFVMAAQMIENDYVIWTPIVLYLFHALFLIVMIVLRLLRRD